MTRLLIGLTGGLYRFDLDAGEQYRAAASRRPAYDTRHRSWGACASVLRYVQPGTVAQ